MPAGDIRQICVSPDLIPVMDTCVRPFLCCVSDDPSLCSPRPPARRSVLSCWRPQFSVTHPPLPCVLSGEGLLLRSRACAGLLFAIASSNPHKTNIAKNLSLVHPYVSRTISFHLPLTKAGGVTRPLTKAGGVTRAVKRKKEHRQPKGGMGGRHAAKGF